jgi:hypothetical protein
MAGLNDPRPAGVPQKGWRESQASNLEPLVLEASARPLELHSLKLVPTHGAAPCPPAPQASVLADRRGRKDVVARNGFEPSCSPL